MRSTLVGWILAGVWAAWLAALQGLVAREVEWAPDLSVALFASLAAALSRRDLWRAALAVAAGRIAVSIESPAAILAGFFAAAALARSLSGVVDTEKRAARALLGLALSLSLACWLSLVHAVGAAREAAAHALAPAVDWSLGAALPRALPSAAATALVLLACGGLFARLPGLKSLREGREWRAAAYFR
jgi:hypothetical protein